MSAFTSAEDARRTARLHSLPHQMRELLAEINTTIIGGASRQQTHTSVCGMKQIATHDVEALVQFLESEGYKVTLEGEDLKISWTH